MIDDADVYFHNLRNVERAAKAAKKAREELEKAAKDLEDSLKFVSYEAAVWPELYGPNGAETLKNKVMEDGE